ncbi:MAG: pseudouridine synthase [Burkholderiales bacterium]|nr:pseudouridine synthase [Burkholderiales bacterium]
MKLLLFNKPFGVLSQFSRVKDHATLADYIEIPRVYPAGRLDADSEGLLLLTDYGPWQAYIAEPCHQRLKIYWAQVEGIPDDEALAQLRQGVMLKDGMTRPALARRIDEPANLWARTPPIRFRAAIPTSWLEIGISEGRNRQVRRMTAAVGYPTLRLVRYAVGEWTVDGLLPGQYRKLDARMVSSLPSPIETNRATRNRASRGKLSITTKNFRKRQNMTEHDQ